MSKNRFDDEVQKQGLLNSTSHSPVPLEPGAEIVRPLLEDVQPSILEIITPDPLTLTNKNAYVHGVSGPKSVGSSNYYKSPGYSSPVSLKTLQSGRVKFHPKVQEKFLYDTSDPLSLGLKINANRKNKRQKRTTPSPSDTDSGFRNRLQKVLQNIESGERTIKETFKTALSSLISNASNVMNVTSIETETSQVYDTEQMNHTMTDVGQLVSSDIPVTTSITLASEYVAPSSEMIPDTTPKIQITTTDRPPSSLEMDIVDEFDSNETVPEVASEYVSIEDIDSNSVSKNPDFTSSNVLNVIDGEYSYFPRVTSEIYLDYDGFTGGAESSNDATSVVSVTAKGNSSTNTQLPPVVLDHVSTLNADFPYNTEKILPKARPHTTQMPLLELTDNITSNKQSWTTEELQSNDEDLGLVNNSNSILEEITPVIPVAVRSEADSESDQGELVTDPYAYIVQTTDDPSLLVDTKGNLSSVYKVFKKFVENLSSEIYTEGPLEDLLKEKGLTMPEVMKILWSGTSRKEKSGQQVLGEDSKFYPNSSESLSTLENTVMQSKSTSEYELSGLFYHTKSDYDFTKSVTIKTTPYPDENVRNHLPEEEPSEVMDDNRLLNENQTSFLVTMHVTETQTVETSRSDSGYDFKSQPFNWFKKLKALMNETYAGTQDQDNTSSPQSSIRPPTTTFVPVTSNSGNSSYFDRFVDFLGVKKSVSGDNKTDILEADRERKPLLYASKISDDKQAKESRAKQSEYYLKGDVTEKLEANYEYLSSYNEMEFEEIDIITAFPTPVPENETEDDLTGTTAVFPFSKEIHSEIQNTSFRNRSLDAVIAILKPQVNEASTRESVHHGEREPLVEVRSFERLDSNSSDALPFTSVFNESLDETSSVASTLISYLPGPVQQNSSSGNKSITDVMAIIKPGKENQPSMERTSNNFDNGSNDSLPVSSLFTPGLFFDNSTNEAITVAHSNVFTPGSVSSTPGSVSSTTEGSTSSSNKSMVEVMAILKPFNVSEITTLFPDSTASVSSTTTIPINDDFPTSVESTTEILLNIPEVLPEISTPQIGTLIYTEITSTTVDPVTESSSLAVFAQPSTADPSTLSSTDHMLTSTGTDFLILMHANLPTDLITSVKSEDYYSTVSSDSTIASVIVTSINVLLPKEVDTSTLLPEEVDTSTLLVDIPHPVSEIILSHEPLPEMTTMPTTSGSAETEEIGEGVDLISREPHNHTVVAISSAAAVIGLIMAFVGIALVRKAVKDRKKVYFIQPRSFRHR